ncbi:MAG: spore coat protein CotH [Clostridiaceae bacterium]|nr:spore coat protein CotH [Clostridiaceae bacterium]
MVKSDKINIIVAAAVFFALITSIALVAIGNIQAKSGNLKSEPAYATKIFGADIISINIIADEDDWKEMLSNAMSEQYIMVDVIINGKKVQNVGIRPKGNSSLTQVARSNSNRYSFRLQFDEYINGQTCFGLDSLALNNMLGDYTYMKEYVSFELMHEAGVDAPYFGFADIKVNGESWGLYLAVELYNDSYERCVSGDETGMLYNVKSMDMGNNDYVNNWLGGQRENAPGIPGIQNRDMQVPGMQNPRTQNPGMRNPGIRNPGMQSPDIQNPGMQEPGIQDPDVQNPGIQEPGMQNPRMQVPNIQNPRTQNPGMQNPGTENPDVQNPGIQDPRVSGVRPQVPFGGQDNAMNRNLGVRGGWGSSGGSLEYIGDNIESYGAIFNNVVGKGTEKDFQRVIEALKALSEGRDLETYFDVDKILRYLAAHTIVVNLDSYSSGMAQNYYIYERDGRITILPWDYNLAWGGFQSGNVSSVINFPIDTPVSGVEMSRRPLIGKLFENEEYLERYHAYLQQLIDNYFANGKFEEKIKELDALISDYVKNDPTAFCAYEQYKAAVSAFITLGNLRAQSVQGQLDGTIPSTTAGQNANSSKLISSGDLRLSDLGSMMGGRGGDNMGFPWGMGGWQFGDMPQAGGQVTPPGGQRTAPGEREIPAGGQQGGLPGGQGAPGDGQRTSPGEQVILPGEQRVFPGNFGRIIEGRENNNTPNRLVAPFPAGLSAAQGLRTYNLVLMVVLSILLVAAILFAARFKRSY